MKLSVLFSLLTISVQLSWSQFIAEYSSPETDVEFTAVVNYGVDRFIVAGAEGYNLILVEYSAEGAVLNSRKVIIESENGLVPAKSMLLDADGNLVIAGYKIIGTDTYNEDGNGYVLKYDWEADSILFCKIYDNIGSKFFKIIEPVAGGDYFVCGQNHHPIDLSNVLFRVDRSTGDLVLLNNSSHHPLSDSYYSMTYRTGYFYISTRTQYFDGGTNRMRACQVKMDVEGNIQYVKSYVTDTISTARLYSGEIVNLLYRNYQFIHGDDNGTNINNDLYFVCTKLNGDAAFTKKYDFDGYSNDGLWHSAKVIGSRIVTLGSLYNGADHGGDIFLMMLNKKGNVIWAKSYDFKASSFYYLGRTDMMTINGTNIIVVGTANSTVDGFKVGTIMKVSLLENGTLPGTCFEELSVDATTKTNYSIPTEMTEYNYGEEYDSAIIEKTEGDISLSSIFCQSFGSLTRDDDVLQSGYTDAKLFEKSELIYPNPANTYLIVAIASDENKNSSAVIFDMQGRLIKENKLDNADQEIIEINIQDIVPGFYILQLLDAEGNIISTNNFIKL